MLAVGLDRLGTHEQPLRHLLDRLSLPEQLEDLQLQVSQHVHGAPACVLLVATGHLADQRPRDLVADVNVAAGDGKGDAGAGNR